MQLPRHIRHTLEALKAENRLRTIPNPQKNRIDFSSNDYLGLAKTSFETHKPLTGAGGARLLAGTHSEHIALENRCASHFRGEAALLFNSGYQANVGLLSALGQRGDTFLYDEACHASLKDGIRLSMAGKFSFQHNDLQDLERLLKKTSGNCYIVVESLYSMDGDWCDLHGILELAERHDAWVILDEAHSAGIVGPNGAGFSVGKGLSAKILARIYTFGKAIGRMGAVVVGSQALIDFLVNRSRAWIYSTAMPPELAGAIGQALEASREMEDARKQLRINATILRAALKKECGIRLDPAFSPIFPVVIPGNAAVKAVAEKVQQAGFDVRPILSPTVPEGKERLRIVVHAFNGEEEILGLAKAIGPMMTLAAQTPSA